EYAIAIPPSPGSSPARIICRPEPSTGVPNPRNQTSQGNPRAGNCSARIQQSPQVWQPFLDADLGPSAPRPRVVRHFSSSTSSPPRAETVPLLRVHSSERYPLRPPISLPQPVAPRRCSTPSSLAVFPLHVANAHNFQTRDRSLSIPPPAALRDRKSTRLNS